jgi:acid phosphatase type 7
MPSQTSAPGKIRFPFLAAGEAAATVTLTATPAKLAASDDRITVRWSGLDYVAVYSPPSSRDRDFLGYFFFKHSTNAMEATVEIWLS